MLAACPDQIWRVVDDRGEAWVIGCLTLASRGRREGLSSLGETGGCRRWGLGPLGNSLANWPLVPL